MLDIKFVIKERLWNIIRWCQGACAHKIAAVNLLYRNDSDPINGSSFVAGWFKSR